jgi:type I restriction enzyme S subunit
MVENNLAYKFQEIENDIDYTFLPEQLKYSSISLKEIFNNKLRLEASAFSIDAKIAKEQILKNKNGCVYAWSKNGFIEDCFYGGRAKRNYVIKSTEGAIGFLGSAEMLNIYPKPIKFLSTNVVNVEPFRVKNGTILISRSGTIGKVTFVNKTLSKNLVSEHAIRIIAKKYAGYLFAFLQTETGQTLIKGNIFGAIIDQIEPQHFENIVVPNAPESKKDEIHKLIVVSYDLRDESNELIDKAEKILYQELKLKPIEELKTEYFDNDIKFRNYTTKLSDLRFRLDASYHIPLVQIVEQEIKKHAKEISNIGKLSKDIILAGVFKRTYVDKENGVPFLGGRDITQLNPRVEKFLSKSAHAKRIEKELEVFENTVLISDRGTIGKVQIVPKHWNGWAVSQNIIKVIANSNDLAGYLYCFLSSDYGQILINREIYGSVVDMIDDKNVSGIHIPILKDSEKQKEINDLILKANKLRYNAHLKEQEALKKMEDIINSTK